MNVKLDSSIDAVLKRVNDHSGQNYFEVLVSSLSELIAADYVLVGEIDLAAHRADTVALWGEGQLGDQLSYDLKGTPCDQVYAGGTCIYPRDIVSLFPEDQMLAELGLQGYVGRSLKDRHGNPIGLLVALFKQQDYASEKILSIFDLFAIRASSELERTQWEKTLQDKMQQLEENNRRLALFTRVFENTNEGMLVTDHNNSILQVNSSFERLCGYSRDELIGSNPSILNSGLQPKSFYSSMWNELTKKGVWQGELWNRHKSGRTYPVWSSISLVKDQQGNITHHIASCKDISSEVDLKEQLYQKVTHDYLTGLSNSFEFTDHASKAIEVARRVGQHVALIRMNIDNLSLVNSSYGYMVGDQLVKAIGERLKSQTRESDVLSRLGGDDFALIVAYNKFSSLENQLKRTIQLFREKVDTEIGAVEPSCSVGISILDDDATDFESMMENAYQALRDAKTNNRGSYSFYNHDLEDHARRNELIEKRLFKAVSQGAIEPHFQPIFRLDDLSIHHCEALARWTDDELGVVSPAEFIPVAEASGLIERLGELILAKAVESLVEINHTLGRTMGVTVNRSPGEFKFSVDQEQNTHDLVQQKGLDPELVCIEITENMMMHSSSEVLEHLKKLRELGFSLALDDFGTGFSSLSYVKHYPFDYLKVDQSFVRDMAQKGDDYLLVKTILQMAQNLGLKTIAEGIETEEQYQLLKELGCDFGQGYWYSKPLCKDELVSFIEHRQ